MSTFEPSKQHLREVLIFLFHLKKKATEAHQLLAEAYPGLDIDVRMCQRWFARFKNGDFDIEDKERPGQPKKFEDKELETLLNQDPSQTQKELAKTLGVTSPAISKRLKAMGMIRKVAHPVPYELEPRDAERHRTKRSQGRSTDDN